MIPSVGSSVNSTIANLHFVPNEPFKQLPADQQAAASRDIVTRLQQVLDYATEVYLTTPAEPQEQEEEEEAEDPED